MKLKVHFEKDIAVLLLLPQREEPWCNLYRKFTGASFVTTKSWKWLMFFNRWRVKWCTAATQRKLLRNKKNWMSGTCGNVDGSPGHNAEWKKSISNGYMHSFTNASFSKPHKHRDGEHGEHVSGCQHAGQHTMKGKVGPEMREAMTEHSVSWLWWQLHESRREMLATHAHRWVH